MSERIEIILVFNFILICLTKLHCAKSTKSDKKAARFERSGISKLDAGIYSTLFRDK
jgi:hypothetical protein